MTSDKDEFLTLDERVEIAKNHAADLFISIHYDAYTSNDVSGITTYYNKPEDQQLAKMMHKQLFKQKMDIRDRGVAQENLFSEMKRRKQSHGNPNNFRY
ncbi:hypothetical protein GCM10008018_65890 [Paenibacillus marchantiophytorum]|uniref:MurNAc-LAA domain-containing protein n=1 Tax=Paenibacillus marchantiophytorum TaxID=1619310 RepID=A0ABQ1FFZ3_9BACL|nr:hypothetical protein GCM10008018_65890 [Paenibacillus marchantiophytorum]